MNNDDIYFIGNNCAFSDNFDKGIIDGRIYNIWDNNNCNFNNRSFNVSDEDWKTPKYNRDYTAFKEFLDKLKKDTVILQRKLDKERSKPKKIYFWVCSNWKRFVKGVHRVYKTIIAYIKKGISNDNE